MSKYDTAPRMTTKPILKQYTDAQLIHAARTADKEPDPVFLELLDRFEAILEQKK